MYKLEWKLRQTRDADDGDEEWLLSELLPLSYIESF